MISLDMFIKQCEKDLILKRSLLDNTLANIYDLSEKDKILCKPIINFIVKHQIEVDVDTKNMEFSSKERILVCRLIPLLFALDTDDPRWSSFMLTQAIKSANDVIGINLLEIGTAFLEILCEFATPLNRVVKNFCIDFSRELTAHYRKRLKELESLIYWENSCCQHVEAVAFLKYSLVPIDNYKADFILKTVITLIKSEYFEEFIEGIKYLFEDLEYKQNFLECLLNLDLPKTNKDLIISILNLY
ncbi:MAG: hypothetical protein MUE81_02145 [Thermoflexibacter sp.]|jgi:hypothetical protein|nr:hypothetical protein [Thermoflexibacter sp.]